MGGLMNLTQKLKQFKNERNLAFRLSVYILICSLCFMLFAVALQLFMSYREELSLVERRMAQIEDSYVMSLSQSVWEMDTLRTAVLLNGMMQLPDMRYVMIRTPGTTVASSGTPKTEQVIRREFTLSVLRNAKGLMPRTSAPAAGGGLDSSPYLLGTLTVVVDLEGIRHRLISGIPLILGTQALQIFFVLCFIMVILEKLLIRHLATLAGYTGQMDIDHLEQPLFLDRDMDKREAADELDSVVNAINAMRLRLISGIDDRKRTEAQLIQYRDHLESLVDERTAELKSANADLLAAKNNAETANRAKSTFFANMSHELRTPLNVILGFTQLMSRDTNLPAGNRDEIEIINHSGNHLLGLINDVLDISKIESGRMSLTPQDFDLHLFLDRIDEMFHSRSRAKQLSFVMEKEGSLPAHVRADEGRLRQVLINLIGNAVKFSDKGSVTLRVRAMAKNTSAPSGKALLHFEVEDTGIGIADAHLDTIFVPFVQTDRHGGENGGTGLGLAISRQFVELMGGKIAARSEPGKGSVFHFHIPAEVVEAERFKPAPAPRRVISLKEGQPRFKILIVEDLRESRILLSRLLQSVGFTVYQAENGREGVEMFQEFRPDFIWMDIRMPVMDGLAATRMIKAEREGKKTPVVALTAHAFEDERKEILAAGCNEFVRKPFQEAEVFSTMQTLLGVEYEYEKTPETANTAPEAVTMLPRGALDHLSPPLLDELKAAVLCIDMERIREVVDRIRPTAPSTADLLIKLAEDFRYEEILAEIDNREIQSATPTPQSPRES